MLTTEDGRKLFERVHAVTDSQTPRRTQLIDLRTMLEGILREELGETLVYGLNLHDQILHISAHRQLPRSVRMAMHEVRKRGNDAVHFKGKGPLDSPPEPRNDDYYDACSAMCEIIAHLSAQPIPAALDQFLAHRAITAAPVMAQPVTLPPTAAQPVVAPSIGAEATIAATPVLIQPAVTQPATARPVRTPAKLTIPDALPFLRMLIRKVKQEVKATPKGVQKTYTLLGLSDEYDIVEVKLTEQFAEVGALAWPYATVHLFNLQRVPGAENQLTMTPSSLAVLEPDYLVDVTDAAETYQLNAADVDAQHVSALLTTANTSEAMLLGSIVNGCFDEIMADPSQTPDAIFQHALTHDHRASISALALRLNTEALRGRARDHITTLRGIVNDALAQGADFTVEPTFLSERYGLQGRLDALLEYVSDPQRVDILELKSGRAPKIQPSGNGWRIWPTQEAQALCYALLTEEPFPKRTGANSIVYSADMFDPVRPANDTIRMRQDVLAARNRVVALAHRMQQGLVNLPVLFSTTPSPTLAPFTKERVATISSRISGASTLERAYYARMTQFIAREQWMAKVGVNPEHGAVGMAGLWRSEIGEKRERFDIMSGLTPILADGGAPDHTLSLTRDASLQETANFREGDVAILYPLELDGSSQPTRHQILKCVVRQITKDVVTVRLNNRRVSQRYFAQFANRPWALEHDLINASFDRMYQSLTLLLGGKSRMRDLLLGQRQPEFGALPTFAHSGDLTPHQHEVIQRALSARDCYLIQGPPGAGKTSRVIRELVRRLVEQPSETVLLLAYTNRAVDEICDAVADITPAVEFIRLGSPSSTKLAHQSRVLASAIADGASIEDVGQRIRQSRVVVSTALAFLGHLDLLKLKPFTTAMVDEASQLLDPHLVGPLSQVDRFILIGDHYQLPAVVTQSPADTLLTNDVPDEAALRMAGITDLRMSLFERLWNWLGQSAAGARARSTLTEQGRMHAAIQAFPNERFYEGRLGVLSPRQQAPLTIAPATLSALPPSLRTVAELLADERMIFIPTTGGLLGGLVDTRSDLIEAGRVAGLVRTLQATYGAKYNADETIGVISPWRAQVAAIRAALDRADLSAEAPLVDTVERYQGSERDVIIISFATNDVAYVQGMTDLWRGTREDGAEHAVDRKLNVALTRAREQVILLGRLETLAAAADGQYGELFAHISEHGRYFTEHECAALDRLAAPVAAAAREAR